MVDDHTITIGQQIEEVARELAMRKRVYPAMIQKGKLREDYAELHMRRMLAVLETLQRLGLKGGE